MATSPHGRKARAKESGGQLVTLHPQSERSDHEERPGYETSRPARSYFLRHSQPSQTWFFKIPKCCLLFTLYPLGFLGGSATQLPNK